jgi:anaerobic ribonucleoside-triphosphate reductase
MRRIDLTDTPFNGTSRSVSLWDGARRWPECKQCGSSLAGRLERTSSTSARVVEIFRRRCGRGRHVRREVAV